MTQDWAWRVVFMDGSQFLARGKAINNGKTFQFGEMESHQRLIIPIVHIKYIVPISDMDWPDGLRLMQILGPAKDLILTPDHCKNCGSSEIYLAKFVDGPNNECNFRICSQCGITNWAPPKPEG